MGTRKIAIEQGAETYEGRPCKHHGITTRKTKCGRCLECAKNWHKMPACIKAQKKFKSSAHGKAARKAYESTPEFKAWNAKRQLQYKAEHLEAYLKYQREYQRKYRAKLKALHKLQNTKPGDIEA